MSANLNLMLNLIGLEIMFSKTPPYLDAKKSKSTSEARAMVFKRVAVSQFFRLLLETVGTCKLVGERIYNYNEMKLALNPKALPKF